MIFEWDEAKRDDNLRKHGIDFVDALGVFSDPERLEGFDTGHSAVEDRWWTVGECQQRVLFVVFTERRGGSVTRLISARKAMRHEAEAYHARRDRR